MSKLETFEGKQTQWTGLWWHPENNIYTSATINLSTLRKFKGTVRLYVRKNPGFKGGMNGRPNYLFCLKDAKTNDEHGIELNNGVYEKIKQLKELMRKGNCNADQMMLASESRYRAESLMSEAIAIIEDITGEKWEFTWTTY